MAVSVRAAYSMPHLYCPDFDLSPKSCYSREARWGSTSPVYILSLLEIVEQDSVHMQEAAPRLKPGWVRNACAAFERGTAPVSSADKKKPVESCHQDVVKEAKPDLPTSSRPSLGSRTSGDNRNSPKSRLSKAKSLDCLLTHSEASGKSRVPTPKELQRNASFSTSSKLPQKENLQEIRRKLKPPRARDQSRAKPLHEHSPSSELKVSPGAGSGAIQSNGGQNPYLCGGCLLDEAKSKLPGESKKVSGDTQVLSAAQLIGKSAASSISSQITAGAQLGTHDGPVGPKSSISSAASPTSSCDISHSPSSSSSAELCNKPLEESVLLPGTRQSDTLDIPSAKEVAISETPKSTKDGVTLKVDSCQVVKENRCGNHIPPEELTASIGKNSTDVSEGGVSVRPKSRPSEVGTLDLFTDSIEKIGNGTFSGCVLRANNQAIDVTVRSSSVGNAKPVEKIPGDGVGKDVDQSAMNDCVIAHHVVGSSYSCEDVSLVSSSREIGGKDGRNECPVRLSERSKYPLDKLELFLLVKEVFKLGRTLEWSNCQVYFNSYRDLQIPRPRFSSVCSLSLEGCSALHDSRADHIADLKEALDRKWSRSSVLIERRKAFLSEARLGTLRYQLLTHPLVWFDPLDVEESGSDSDGEDICDDTFTYFSLIPTYVIAKIFSFLDTRDLAALKCTCVDFHWLINQFDIMGLDCQWNAGEEYRNDPCMHCGKIRDPRGDNSLCRRHPKMYYSYSHIGRRYWTCCNAVDRRAMGCQVGLHNNRWTTSQFEPHFISKPWKSRAWFVTANHELWCDREHL